MAQEFSFDIVSKTDMQEVANAIQQAQKELAQRFDFKGSKSAIELNADEIVLLSDDEGKLRSVKDIVETKLVKRKVSLKALDYAHVEPAAGGALTTGVITTKPSPVGWHPPDSAENAGLNEVWDVSARFH